MNRYKNYSKQSIFAITALLCNILSNSLEGFPVPINHTTYTRPTLVDRLTEGAWHCWSNYGKPSVQKSATCITGVLESALNTAYTTITTNSTYNSFTTTPFFMERLMDAISNQDLATAKHLLLFAPGLIFEKDNKGDTPLNMAACCWAPSKGCPILDFILNMINNSLFKMNHKNLRAFVNQKSGFLENTPLITAVLTGNKEGVNCLLYNGADIDATNKCGETALLKALQTQHKKIAFRLIEKGASLKKALVTATKQEDLKTLKYALHLKDKDGNTFPMHTKTVEELETMLRIGNTVDLKTDLHPQDDLILTSNAQEETLLHHAVGIDSLPMLSYLLKNGLIKWINHKNTLGKTPLFFINIGSESCLKIAQLLVDNGANIEEPNNKGQTVVMRSIKKAEKTNTLEDFKRALSLLDFLISKGADINAENLAQNTALSSLKLTKNYSENLLTYLAKRGGDLNHQDSKHGWAPLHRAAFRRPELVPLLINLGAGWLKNNALDKSLCLIILTWPGGDWGLSIKTEKDLLRDIWDSWHKAEDKEEWDRDHGNFSNKKYATKLLTKTVEAILEKFTSQNDIKLPLKQPVSREVLNGFLSVLDPQCSSITNNNTLESICSTFICALSTDEGLSLSSQEKTICDQYFTMTPSDFRAKFFAKKKQDAYLNTRMKKQLKELVWDTNKGADKKMFQDITIIRK